jgi:hypothetical protein
MKFLRNDNTWNLFSNEAADMRDILPSGVYTIRYNDLSGQFFLEDSEPFGVPSKIYGKTEQYCERIIRSFGSRKENSQIGALLEGTKGSGKTLLAKLISVRSGLPTIIVNTPFTGEKFMRTLQSITQPAVVIFDEFEKLYDSEKQEQVLTMFDGVYTLQNKIIIVTSNDRYAIRDFFHNRPSRLRYSIHYDGLDTDFIVEYCQDNLKDKSYTEKVKNYASSCLDFNFDMLQVMVEELNNVGGNFDETVEILNVKTMGYGQVSWSVQIKAPKDYEGKIFVEEEVIGYNPIEYMSKYGSFNVEVRIESNEESDSGGDYDDDHHYDERFNYETFSLGISNIVKADNAKGIAVFKCDFDNHTFEIILKKKEKNRLDV